MITNEIIESQIGSILGAILNYKGDDAGFIKVIKEQSASLIVKIISEIEEGFIDGMNDVVVFFKANIIAMLMASAPPQQANMAKGIAIPAIIKFVEKSWNESRSKLAETVTPHATPKAETSQAA